MATLYVKFEVDVLDAVIIITPSSANKIVAECDEVYTQDIKYEIQARIRTRTLRALIKGSYI